MQERFLKSSFRLVIFKTKSTIINRTTRKNNDLSFLLQSHFTCQAIFPRQTFFNGQPLSYCNNNVVPSSHQYSTSFCFFKFQTAVFLLHISSRKFLIFLDRASGVEVTHLAVNSPCQTYNATASYQEPLAPAPPRPPRLAEPRGTRPRNPRPRPHPPRVLLSP